MATLYKRKRNWYIDYRYKGKRYQKRLGPSRELAERAKIDLEYKIANDRLGLFQKEIKLLDLISQFGKQVEVNVSQNTKVRYREVLGHFRKFIEANYADLLIHQAREFHIEHYKGERQKCVKPRTVNFEVVLIKSMFKHAVKNKYLPESPISGVKMLPVQRKKPVFLEQEEITLLLNGCPERFRPAYLTFLHTGMRAGELINLEWTDVDLGKNVIHIRPKEFWQPKTAKERLIPVTSQLRQVLLKLPRTHRWVFTNHLGGQLNRNYLREMLVRIARDQGIDMRIGLHTLRHTFASQLAMQGVSLMAIKDLLGHSTADTTLIYAHLSQNHLAEAVKNLNFRVK